jgi:hypothetical protein
MEVRRVEGHSDLGLAHKLSKPQVFFLRRLAYLRDLGKIPDLDHEQRRLVDRAMFTTYRDLRAAGVPKDILLGCLCPPKQPPVDEGAERLAKAVREEMEGEG